MSRKYLSYNGRILEIYSEDTHCLHVEVNSLDISVRKWKQTANFTWTSKVKVELLSVAEILEETTCRRIPVALIALDNSKRSINTGAVCYLVYVNIESEKCFPLRKFSLDPKMLTGQSVMDLPWKVQILDGPSVLYLYESNLSLYNGKVDSKLKQYCFPMLTDCKTCLSSFCRAMYFCSKCVFRITFIFIVISYDTPCNHCQRIGSQALLVLQFQDGEFTNIDTNEIIPKEFHDQLKCICVKSLKLDEDKALKSSEIYACTQTGLVLSLKDGCLIRCVSFNESLTTQITMNKEEKIVLQLIDSGDKIYLVAVKGQTCVFLDPKLEIQKQYLGVNNYFCGDFIGNGTVQCLVLKSASIHDSGWILDDFNQLCFNPDEQELSEAKEEAASTSTATKALLSRLQHEQLVLQEKKQSLCKKKEFMKEMVDSQLLSAAGVETYKLREKVDLLTLVGEKTEEVNSALSHKSGMKPPVVVCDQWQRTYNNQWCVGVEFYWESVRNAEVWLNIVPARDSNIQLRLKSKPIMCRSGVQEFQSRQKKKRVEKTFSNVLLNDLKTTCNSLEARLYTATCVTDIPNFLKKSISIFLNIKWRYLQSDIDSDLFDLDDHENNVISFTEKTVFTQQCGKITIESQAVIHQKHEITFTDCSTQDVFTDHFMEDFSELQRSKLAWKHLQTSTYVIIKSSAGVLSQLDKLLVDRCSFVYNSHFQCYITHVNALCKVQVELPPSSKDDCRHLIIHASSDKDLLLLLHHLYHCLPDNIVILPDNNNSNHLQEVLTRMHQETSFFSQGVRKLLDENQDSEFSADSKSQSQNEDFTEIGERFKRKREEFLEKDKKLVETSDMEEFLAMLTLLQKKTDVCVARENCS